VICQKAPKDSAQYETCKQALQSVSKPFPLVSSSRWMVKRGELTAFVEENGIFSKRTSRQQVYFFLFNDVLILTRKKRSTAGMLTSRQPGASHIFRLRFRSNHSGDKVPMVLGVELMLLFDAVRLLFDAVRLLFDAVRLLFDAVRLLFVML
ncbi:unnamed protein product, partial [Coregonus sp. 'balchen']